MHPLLFNLKDKKLLFIGGGKVAERKVKSLIDTGAVIYVIAPEITFSFTHENLRLINKEYEDSDINGDEFLVFVCTDNRGVNKSAAARAKALKIPVNVADDPENCDFHMPSVIKNEEFTISVSTGGKDPSKAKALRIKLEEIIRKEL